MELENLFLALWLIWIFTLNSKAFRNVLQYWCNAFNSINTYTYICMGWFHQKGGFTKLKSCRPPNPPIRRVYKSIYLVFFFCIHTNKKTDHVLIDMYNFKFQTSSHADALQKKRSRARWQKNKVARAQSLP